MRRRLHADAVSSHRIFQTIHAHHSCVMSQPPRVPVSLASHDQQGPSPSFPMNPPQMVPNFVTPTQRAAWSAKAKERILRGQPANIPVIPLRPLAPSTTPASGTDEPSPATTARVPTSVISFDPEDPASVRAMASIVGAVLKELGIEGTSVAKTRGRVKPSGSRQARAGAIRAQQALMTPEEDCAWKVCRRQCWCANS
jgi:hypothetical protein